MRLGAEVAPGKKQRKRRHIGTLISREAFKSNSFTSTLLTNDAEDVSDGGHKDDQQIDHEDETNRDADVYQPAERLVREKDLQQGPANLWRGGNQATLTKPNSIK